MEKIKLDDFLKLERHTLEGKVFCFPTDTVYGLSALYGDCVGISKIFQIKHRSPIKPLANLCSNINQIIALGIEISPLARKLMEKYWPGPLTLILKGLEDKISFRMPDSPIALKILDKFSVLPTTSVNESGEAELNFISDIEKKFKYKIDYLITDSSSFSGLPSTVVDLSEDKIKVLRQGAIYLE
jgi:tRNA threonylcarbamoyl adenosine modification protein (Sua5/YciO/YrdC/YwlC family)